MKIEVKQDRNGVSFEDIFAGVVFRDDETYYIKTIGTFRHEGIEYNAISLDDGAFAFFVSNDEVFVPSAKLVIE